MTKKQYRIQEWEAVVERDNWTCVICNVSVNNKRGQAAHLIPQSQVDRFGYYVIYSRHCQKLTCSLECNKKVELHSWECRAKAKEIKELMDDNIL